MTRQALVVKSGHSQELNVMGGNVRFLCEAKDTGAAWSVMEVVVPRDAGPPPHDHDWDEAYYVTHGEFEFTIGAETLTATTGDFLITPGGTLHGFRGISEDPARMLIFDIPAHAASFFKEVDREVQTPSDMARIPEIGLRNGIRFQRAA